MNKLNKPLKGLFSKTEEQEEVMVVIEEVNKEPLESLKDDFCKTESLRDLWNELDYASYIRKIDSLQSRAFFLKGILLKEVKDRFFIENKSGWKGFAEESLGMNYTTANQYIRVAEEFDVTSHHRVDFGFEHFKALLPLSVEDRESLLQMENISVKDLREMVRKKLFEYDIGLTSLSGKKIINKVKNFSESINDAMMSALCEKDRCEILNILQNMFNKVSLGVKRSGGEYSVVSEKNIENEL